MGYNVLTAMPQLWISGDALQSPIAYVGMDNNAIAVGLSCTPLPLMTTLLHSRGGTAWRCTACIRPALDARQLAHTSTGTQFNKRCAG